MRPSEPRRQRRFWVSTEANRVCLEDLQTRRANAKKLIEAGAIISVGGDTLLFGRPGVAPEFLRSDHAVPEHLEPESV